MALPKIKEKYGSYIVEVNLYINQASNTNVIQDVA
jgi:hypothetical protein